MAAPVGSDQEVGRDAVERRAARLGEAPGVAVVTAPDFHRGLGEEAAGAEADLTERIVVEPETTARRLTGDGAGDRGRHRRGDAHGPRRRGRVRPVAGTDRLRLRCARVKFRLEALAVERIEAGHGSAGGRRDVIGRHRADARPRGWLLLRSVRGGRLRSPAQWRLLGRHETIAHRGEKRAGQGLGAGGFGGHKRQHGADRQRAPAGHAPMLRPSPLYWPRPFHSHLRPTPPAAPNLNKNKALRGMRPRGAQTGTVNGVKTNMVNAPLRGRRPRSPRAGHRAKDRAA